MSPFSDLFQASNKQVYIKSMTSSDQDKAGIEVKKVESLQRSSMGGAKNVADVAQWWAAFSAWPFLAFERRASSSHEWGEYWSICSKCWNIGKGPSGPCSSDPVRLEYLRPRQINSCPKLSKSNRPWYMSWNKASISLILHLKYEYRACQLPCCLLRSSTDEWMLSPITSEAAAQSA